MVARLGFRHLVSPRALLTGKVKERRVTLPVRTASDKRLGQTHSWAGPTNAGQPSANNNGRRSSHICTRLVISLFSCIGTPRLLKPTCSVPAGKA